MSSTVFAKYILLEFSLDEVNKMPQDNEQHREYGHFTYGTGRKRMEHDFTDAPY